ncbi:hypothetical protein KDA_62410 [Dictyobacter alpinus]|uniref:Uncharacterized protein n=1 Tax=Dictyobacter alpinus TaxID=2014873 RepID=A0A402BHM7_9CHLR|nr:hypothetical protein [Dictyobacter alpinus]GCE30757.1 hypothetical protein KDA_62410 [Dictyobacter alpinus]
MTTKRSLKNVLKIFAIILLVILLDATVNLEWSINDVLRVAGGTQPGILQPPTRNAFFFQLAPPWGSAVLDGQPLLTLPQNKAEAPLSLPIGEHRVQWHAEPFGTQECIFSVPVTSEARHTCQLTSVADSSDANATYTVSFAVRPTLNSLSVEQRKALIQATQKYLDTLQSHETIQPGEPFRYNASSPALTATKPISAHLRFLLDTDTTTIANCQGPSIGTQCRDGLDHDCRLFCTQFLAQPDPTNAKPAWEVFVVTRPTWDYRQPDGSPVSAGPQKDRLGDQQYSLLRILWDQDGWHVEGHKQGDSSFDDPNCTLMISQILDFSTLSSTDPAPNSDAHHITIKHWTFASAQNRALGCLSTLTAARADGSSVPALFLWRFGVLLTANQAASSFEPHIPPAHPTIGPIIQAIKDHPAFVS